LQFQYFIIFIINVTDSVSVVTSLSKEKLNSERLSKSHHNKTNKQTNSHFTKPKPRLKTGINKRARYSNAELNCSDLKPINFVLHDRNFVLRRHHEMANLGAIVTYQHFPFRVTYDGLLLTRICNSVWQAASYKLLDSLSNEVRARAFSQLGHLTN
jgi:hypothetical protein